MFTPRADRSCRYADRRLKVVPRMTTIVALALLPLLSAAKPELARPALATAPTLAISGLAPAKSLPYLCQYRYRVSTASDECQRFCDQGSGYYYSYVWIEAVRSFETALRADPECAMAWLGLHKSLEKWGKTTAKPNVWQAAMGAVLQPRTPDRFAKAPHDFALLEAQRLMKSASHREQLLITAKLQERGIAAGVGPDDRKKKAQATLDELLAIYPDDEEGWFARSQLTDNSNAAISYHISLLRLNPYHPGANHELVHLYENIRRPALGWEYAEGYIKSSPGIPHAFHMQAHLGMRIGKWQKTTDYSWQAIELQREYHRVQGVEVKDDHQYSHHLETLTRSLVHDGRFADAKQIRTIAESHKFSFRPEWFRMAIALEDWADAQGIVEQYRKSDKSTAAYYGALLAIAKRDTATATAELDTLRGSAQSNRGERGRAKDRSRDLRLWEIQGRIECLSGNGEAGLKLIRRTIDKTKDDFAHHAWAGGAYYMESWGFAALDAGNLVEAEEAFLEALAHDSGSVRAALALKHLCERLGRTDEAERYSKLAHKLWAKATPPDFDRLQAATQIR